MLKIYYMKSKIIFQVFVATVLAIVYITMKSNSAGIFNGGTSCTDANCHAALSTNTILSLTGLPSTYNVNQTYNLSFSITNSSYSKGGFNIFCTGGQFIAGADSKTNTGGTTPNNEITHIAPKNAASGVTTFNFTWKAPSNATSITFNCAGNAVVVDNNTLNDQWNTAAFTTICFPAKNNSITTNELKCYPNPVSNTLFLELQQEDITTLRVYNTLGNLIHVNYTKVQNSYRVDCSALANGYYIGIIQTKNGKYKTSFFKN